MIGKIDIALSVSLDTVNITFALSYWREKNRERCLYYTKILELDFSAFPFLFLLTFPDVFCFPFWLLPSSLRRRALAPPVLGLLGGLIRNVFGEPGGLIFISFSYCMVTLFGGGDGARFDSKSDKMKILITTIMVHHFVKILKVKLFHNVGLDLMGIKIILK